MPSAPSPHPLNPPITLSRIDWVFVSWGINRLTMKRPISYLLPLGMALLVGVSSCNSAKRTAANEAAMEQQKREQVDRDKMRFEKALPATATE